MATIDQSKTKQPQHAKDDEKKEDREAADASNPKNAADASKPPLALPATQNRRFSGSFIPLPSSSLPSLNLENPLPRVDGASSPNAPSPVMNSLLALINKGGNNVSGTPVNAFLQSSSTSDEKSCKLCNLLVDSYSVLKDNAIKTSTQVAETNKAVESLKTELLDRIAAHEKLRKKHAETMEKYAEDINGLDKRTQKISTDLDGTRAQQKAMKGTYALKEDYDKRIRETDAKLEGVLLQLELFQKKQEEAEAGRQEVLANVTSKLEEVPRTLKNLEKEEERKRLNLGKNIRTKAKDIALKLMKEMKAELEAEKKKMEDSFKETLRAQDEKLERMAATLQQWKKERADDDRTEPYTSGTELGPVCVAVERKGDVDKPKEATEKGDDEDQDDVFEATQEFEVDTDEGVQQQAYQTPGKDTEKKENEGGENKPKKRTFASFEEKCMYLYEKHSQKKKKN